MIKIIDCGIGNYKTIASLLESINRDFEIIDEINEISYSDIYILPGIGSFDALVKNLKKTSIYYKFKNCENDKLRLIGICLGAQVLLDKSEEGTEFGLGLISGEVKRFKDKKLNVGWNYNNKNIYNDIYNERFYFVHGYYMVSKFCYLSSIFKNEKFCSVVKDKYKIGIQFHPERSGIDGMRFFDEMLKLCE
ncbi:imidazole glycerol phosphate synthase subunit HisH [Aequoribacter fuscus]|uniref:imidazole glycerol phosphate synthase subunit HisH n=1 Tax=Aequoribacter fuscus TaxID=2518989 RepID=UPI0002E82EEE|nr:imidazole glycerol phosphate synthase subunit HisH [Aequoribacter fuscus]QHJ88891.1 imidazole glycerol phosphate synthase subunit HisH [Aequoribacter fuscus]